MPGCGPIYGLGWTACGRVCHPPATLRAAGADDPNAIGPAVGYGTDQTALDSRRTGVVWPDGSCRWWWRSFSLVVLIFGSRSLLGQPLPAVGQLPVLSGGWSGLWRSLVVHLAVERARGDAPSSPALALLGLLGTALFGAVGALQHLVVLGPLLSGRSAPTGRPGGGAPGAAG